MTEVLTTIPSHGRPHRVEIMEELLDGLNPHWVVNDKKDLKEYQKAGAKWVCIGGPSAAANKMAATDLAGEIGRYCFMIDDDVNGFVEIHPHARALDNRKKSLHPTVVVETLKLLMEMTMAPLVGIHATPNAGFGKNQVRTHSAVNGPCQMRDPKLWTWTVPEDILWNDDRWDTCEAIRAHGFALVADWIVYANNPFSVPGAKLDGGGIGDKRTHANYTHSVNRLIEEFPEIVRAQRTPQSSPWPGKVKFRPPMKDSIAADLALALNDHNSPAMEVRRNLSVW